MHKGILVIGSTWQKWDLHIHSPLTHLNNQFSGTIQDYVSAMIKSELSLIGVTNYFYFKQNELEIVRSTVNKMGHNLTVLGNVEFRITQPNNQGEWINMHCIFSENLSTEQINNVLSTMPLMNTSSAGMTVYCSEASMLHHGISVEHAVVDYASLCAHFKAHLRYGVDYLVGICPNGYGGFRPTQNVGRSLAIAFEMEKKGDLIFGSNDDTRTFFLDSARFKGAISKPVIKCSDSHCLEQIGTQYSWIKARPTFEGLRQVLIEPEERIQITDSFIERTFIKPRFESIKAKGVVFKDQPLQFNDTTIYLNPNMVTIIGGRGTGKSILLDAIRSKFKHNPFGVEQRQVDIEEFSLTLDQGEGNIIEFSEQNNNYDYLHVSQGDIQNISQNPEKLSGEIKRMLGLHENIFAPLVEKSTVDALSRYRNFITYWLVSDANGNAVNTDNYQNSIILNYTKLITTLTSPQNKNLIERYQNNVKNINELNTYINSCNQLKAQINETIPLINIQITNINTNKITSANVLEIGYETSLKAIEINITNTLQVILTMTTDNQNIVGEFQKQGINQDISSLLSKVTEYQSQIDSANAKLAEIKNKTSEYQADVVKRSAVANEYKLFLENEEREINQAYQSLSAEKTTWNNEQNLLVRDILVDISIYGNICFDVERFFNGLLECLNKGKFRETTAQSTMSRLKEVFPINTPSDFFNLISNLNVITISNTEVINLENFCWKNEYFNQSGRFDLLDYIFTPQSIKSFLYVNAEFRYKNKTVDKLSVGQRGTFYVCLKLATDPFGSPFIFDQPEDDLDNDFIMHNLVPLFRKIKKYRQVIVVTHNANLVVNSDAEQVIVAHNDNEILSYYSGAVEDGLVSDTDSIRSQICNILEGGGYAFEMREKKYGLHSL
jgi:hypothetical protein